MGENNLVYSIQRSYILNFVFKHKKPLFTCNQRIDIPTIEPLTEMEAVVYQGHPVTVVPCIELVFEFFAEFNLTFVTNEGVTVLPVEIKPGSADPLENPYLHRRYVLVLPRGTTGIKSCKLMNKDGDIEVQNNFTFGIMPPPYNYDNALFGYLSSRAMSNYDKINNLEDRVTALENKAGG